MSGTDANPRIFWLDAQLPPSLALWLKEAWGVEAYALRELGLRDAEDLVIFEAARRQGAVLISKDSDFVGLIQRLGVPPRMLWLTCGNVTNAHLRALLSELWPKAMALLDEGEPIVEIGDIA